MDLNERLKEAKEKTKIYKYLLEKSDKNKILKLLPDLHEQAFQEISCLDCANCCKNYSPRFKNPDIKRIAKALGVKEGLLVEKYLTLDEDGDYVTNSKPCPFLEADNKCMIYDVRPSDCARYPYTDEDIIIKRVSLTIKNSTICPAVQFVLDKLEQTLKLNKVR